MIFNYSLHKVVASIFAAAFTFGLYTASLLICLRWLFFADESWNFRRRIRWTVIIGTFLIFACNIVYVAMVLLRGMEKARGVEADMESLAPDTPAIIWSDVLSYTALNCNLLVADIVLIYRCWIVYGKRLLVILFPGTLWLGGLLCTILQIYLQGVHTKSRNIGPSSWASVNMSIGPGIVLIPFWISTVLLSAYCTTALIRRIHGTAEKCKEYTSVKHLNLAVRIIAESGLLNLSIRFAHLLVWFGREWFPVDMISVLNVPIVGIAFNWFVIRFEQAKADGVAAESAVPELTTIRFQSKSVIPVSFSQGGAANLSTNSMPIQLPNVSTSYTGGYPDIPARTHH